MAPPFWTSVGHGRLAADSGSTIRSCELLRNPVAHVPPSRGDVLSQAIQEQSVFGAAEHGSPLPSARGDLSEYIIAGLLETAVGTAPTVRTVDDPLIDDDLQLALYLCYELHYRSFAGVADDREWDPTLLAFRAELETAFLARLSEDQGPSTNQDPETFEVELSALIGSFDGPSLSAYLGDRGTLMEMREFAVHRSAYQRKEADPHTWGIPRLDGPAKAALVRIQADEYGFGRHDEMHYHRFAVTMEALGLDATYGAYLHCLPGSTLASVNVISLFGLHRRWRGALVGHLTVYEMTSVIPMSRYSAALGRLGVDPVAREFYDVHVTADAQHRWIALYDLAGGLARQEPQLRPDILFGVQATLEVEARFAQHLLDRWAAASSSLRGSEPFGIA